MWFPLLLAVVSGSAFAKGDRAVPGGAAESAAAVMLGREWDCEDTWVDTSNKKGLGLAACLRTYAVDPATGASFVRFSVVHDSGDPRALDDYDFDLKLGFSGKTKRRIRVFGTDATDAVPSKPAPTKGSARQTFDVVFGFTTFDSSHALESVALKVKGVSNPSWDLQQPLVWSTPIAETPGVRVPRISAGACTFARVGPADTDAVAEHLSNQRSAHAFEATYQWVVNEAGTHTWYFREPDFRVMFDQNRLVVRGSETWDTRLSGVNLNGENNVRLAYDGDSLSVAVNDQRMGPIFVRQRDLRDDRLRWELELEGDAFMQGLSVSACTPLPDAVSSAAPPAPVSAPMTPTADPGGRSRPRGFDPVKAMAAIQSGMETASVLGEAAGDMQQNVDAMQSGDVSRMKSTDTKISIGPGGTSVSHSTAQVHDDGSATLTHSEARAGGAAGAGLSSFTISGLTPAHTVLLDGATLPFHAATGAFVAVGIRPGAHRMVIRGAGGDEWSADATPAPGKHESCLAVPTGIGSYTISCGVTGPAVRRVSDL